MVTVPGLCRRAESTDWWSVFNCAWPALPRWQEPPRATQRQAEPRWGRSAALSRRRFPIRAGGPCRFMPPASSREKSAGGCSSLTTEPSAGMKIHDGQKAHDMCRKHYHDSSLSSTACTPKAVENEQPASQPRERRLRCIHTEYSTYICGFAWPGILVLGEQCPGAPRPDGDVQRLANWRLSSAVIRRGATTASRGNCHYCV